ncbi:MAG: DUF4912 domain-containing protein [Bacillota bacterium]
MEVFAWILVIALLALATAVYLWSSRRPVKKLLPSVPPPADVEFGAEISPYISPSSPAKPALYTPELPRRYGKNQMALLARDPYWLFAYWEISATKQEEFAARYGPEAWHTSRPVLRLYDVTGVDFKGNNANTYVDISVNEEADNWYMEVGQPNRSFCVDLGRMLSTGQFVTLLRSNLAHTPRASLSERFDEEWMWLEGIYRSLLRYQFGLSSPILFEEVAARMGKEFIPIGISSPVGLPLGISSPGVSSVGISSLIGVPERPVSRREAEKAVVGVPPSLRRGVPAPVGLPEGMVVPAGLTKGAAKAARPKPGRKKKGV